MKTWFDGHINWGIPPLGDVIERALSTVGITEERVVKWLGKPCGCEERKAKMNAVTAWANRVLLGKTDKAAEHFDKITSD